MAGTGTPLKRYSLSPGAEPLFVPSFRVTAVDTTGAGDCFIGTLAAALAVGLSLTLMAAGAQAQTLRWASQGDPQTMDPHSQNESFTNSVCLTLFVDSGTAACICGKSIGWRPVVAQLDKAQYIDGRA